jgi:hypothetical protein
VPGSPGPRKLHFLAHGSTDQIELLVRQPVLPDQPGERGNELRLEGCGLETGGSRAFVWKLGAVGRFMPPILPRNPF